MVPTIPPPCAKVILKCTLSPLIVTVTPEVLLGFHRGEAKNVKSPAMHETTLWNQELPLSHTTYIHYLP